MLEIIRHRGPGGFGIFEDQKDGLGSILLSIIDLAGEILISSGKFPEASFEQSSKDSTPRYLGAFCEEASLPIASPFPKS